MSLMVHTTISLNVLPRCLGLIFSMPQDLPRTQVILRPRSRILCCGAVCWEMLRSFMRTMNPHWVSISATHRTMVIWRVLAMNAAEGSPTQVFFVMPSCL